ncbi:WXG100 family type VII secretion target [Streptomyces sp. NPDC001262]|uniref:WXG100 family type VII secretion target n=1 Tax=Streptomyces TaxID=1883 RepID=UPI00368454C7
MSENFGDLVVTYGSLQDTARDIKSAGAVIKRELEAMSKAVKDVSHGWEGESFAAMTDAQNQLANRAARIQEVLDRVSTLILTGSDDYQQTDRKSAGLFAGH